MDIEHAVLGTLAGELVMYPEGHARNTSGNLPSLLQYKFRRLASLGVDDVTALEARFTNIASQVLRRNPFAIRFPNSRYYLVGRSLPQVATTNSPRSLQPSVRSHAPRCRVPRSKPTASHCGSPRQSKLQSYLPEELSGKRSALLLEFLARLA